MQFEYLQQITSMASLEVDDIGNTAIQCFSDYGETKVLIIRTIDGISEIIEFGPVNTDVKQLPDFVSYTYTRIEFNQRKIAKIISKFINDKIITQAQEIDFDSAKEVIKNLVDYVNLPKESNDDYDRLV